MLFRHINSYNLFVTLFLFDFNKDKQPIEFNLLIGLAVCAEIILQNLLKFVSKDLRILGTWYDDIPFESFW